MPAGNRHLLGVGARADHDVRAGAGGVTAALDRRVLRVLAGQRVADDEVPAGRSRVVERTFGRAGVREVDRVRAEREPVDALAVEPERRRQKRPIAGVVTVPLSDGEIACANAELDESDDERHAESGEAEQLGHRGNLQKEKG